jgi:hypothetical protein
MQNLNFFVVKALFLTVVFTITSCSDNSDLKTRKSIKGFSEQVTIELDIYKSNTCSCCQKWVNHIEDDGFEANVKNITYLNELKKKKGIAPTYRSCHTAESKDGYVFEGHVPAKYIKEYLNNVPEGTLGLAVPAMPVGTPGMEMGDRFMAYQVLLLNIDGTSSIYAEISTYEEQF